MTTERVSWAVGQRSGDRECGPALRGPHLGRQGVRGRGQVSSDPRDELSEEEREKKGRREDQTAEKSVFWWGGGGKP